MVMKNVTKKIQKIPYLFLLMLFSFVTASAQKGITVRGTVLDSNGETIIGASVVLKGNNSIGTISDIDGNFVLTVPNEKSTLIVSYVGMKPQEVKVVSKGLFKVVLETTGRSSSCRLRTTEESECGRCYHADHWKSIGTGGWYF